MSIHRQFTPLNTSAFPLRFMDMLLIPPHQEKASPILTQDGPGVFLSSSGFHLPGLRGDARPQELSLLATI